MTRQPIAVALLLLSLVASLAPAAPGPGGSSCAVAMADAGGFVCEGNLVGARSSGGVAFDAHRGDLVEVTLEGVDGDVDLVLRGGSGQRAASSEPFGRPDTASLHLDADGRVVVEVLLAPGWDESAYVLVVARSPMPLLQPPRPSPPGPDDCGSGRDASEADPVPLAAPCASSVAGTDRDAFALDVPAGRVALVRVVATDRAHIMIHEADRRAWTDHVGLALGREAALAARSGPHVLSVASANHTSMGYTVAVELLEASWSADCANPADSAPGLPAPAEHGCVGALDRGDRLDELVITTNGSTSREVRLLFERDEPLVVRHASATTWSAPRVGPGEYSFRLVDPTPRDWALTLDRPATAERLAYRVEWHDAPRVASDDCGLGDDAPRAPYAEPAPALCAQGRIDEAGDVDEFVVGGVAEPHRVAVLALPGSAAIELQASDAAGEPTDGGWRQLYLPAAATAFARPWGDAGTAYAFETRVLPDDQDDCGLRHDAPSSGALVAEGACRGRFAPGDTRDRYGLHAEVGDFVEYWHDAYGGSRGAWRVTQDGVQWMTLARMGVDDYAFEIRRVPRAVLDDCGLGADAPDDGPGAELPAHLFSCEGALTTAADVADRYTFRLERGEHAVFRAEKLGGAQASFRLTDPAGRPRGLFALDEMPVALVADKPGAWRVDVLGSGSAAYRLALDKWEPPAPGLGRSVP